MSTSKSIQSKMAYVNSTETRTYTINDVATESAVPNTIRQKTQDFNAYLTRTVSTPVFVSPTGAAGEAITEVKLITVDETEIEGV